MLKTKILFICTANINRSRTAEDLLSNSDRYEVRSAGIIKHEQGGQVVTQELIDWADVIFVMDEKYDRHLTRLSENFNLINKEIHVLGIPDRYGRGSKELVELLKSRLSVFGIIFS